MSKQVPWDKLIYEEFVKLALLSDFEKEILYEHIKDRSITQISMQYHVSASKIDRTIARLKKKYDAVQPHSDILPPRVRCAKELYKKNPP